VAKKITAKAHQQVFVKSVSSVCYQVKLYQLYFKNSPKDIFKIYNGKCRYIPVLIEFVLQTKLVLVILAALASLPFANLSSHSETK